MQFIKKNIFNILLIISIIVFLSVSIFKVTTIISYNNSSSIEKAKIIASALNKKDTKIEEDVILEEIEILFNKYSELGYDFENANFNIIASFVLNLYESHEIYLKFEKYLMTNQVEYVNKTDFSNKIFTNKENINIVLQNNLYFSYLMDTAYNHFVENNDFETEKKEIEQYIANEISTTDTELINMYKRYMYNDILEQKFFEKIKEY